MRKNRQTRNMKKYIAAAAAVLLAAGVVMTGCGSSSGSSETGTAGDAAYTEAAYADDAYLNVTYAAEEAADETAAYDSAEAKTVNGTADRTQVPSEQKLVYHGNVSLQTIAYADTMRMIREQLGKYNGFTESESESNNTYDWYDAETYKEKDPNAYQNRNAYLTVRVPSENFEKFMSSLENCGQVMNRSTSTENISRTYSNTEASIEALEKEQTRLLEMMDKAVSVEEMIEVETRLTQVETELNQAKTLLSGMDSSVNYSTITIDITEVHKYTPITPEPETFGGRVKEAFAGTWRFFVKACQGLVLALIWLLPLLIVGGIIAAFVLWLVFRGKKRRALKREQKEAERRAAAERDMAVRQAAMREAAMRENALRMAQTEHGNETNPDPAAVPGDVPVQLQQKAENESVK
ncbi:MAG: DUF4349 domain-containing protein [Eubacteriales bacterium]|nr:DUF4349 domain-containing protein [Eubacteriales bacterium]